MKCDEHEYLKKKIDSISFRLWITIILLSIMIGDNILPATFSMIK